MANFSKYKIKDYEYWRISVHQNQNYLGRCVVWCNREDALDLVDATIEERGELFIILKDLREALKKVFQPDWFNYAFLGNETRHLHGHVFPRYARERQFTGVTFTDELYGHHYRPGQSVTLADEVYEKIKLSIKEALG